VQATDHRQCRTPGTCQILAEVERALEPLRSFQTQWAEEVAWYERVRHRELPVLTRLTQIGRVRIAQGFTQRAPAERLGV
jgi:hypothetical protein